MKTQKNFEQQNRITIQELIDQLRTFDPNSELIFGDDSLTFYRTKSRGESVVQIEFNETILNGQIIR